ncbi:MAG: hypothetical protein IPP40_16480 [bacterium]|nr:hypothetical protein [bacterium]
MEASQNAYDVTTPLLRQVPQSALDAVFGASALVTPDLKLAVVGRTWDEFMARSGRSDLGRNAMLGSPILLFFRNDEQRRVFESLLHSMHSDELGVHNQVVDLGTKEKPFYVQLHVQGLWQEGVFVGYFIHCLDITREHTNRLSLIERDREMMAGREGAEKATLQSNQLHEKLRAALEEIAQREAQLKKMAEKSMRLEKSAKEALERAEKSVEKSSRLQHELDKFRKQQTDNSNAQAELESLQAEVPKLRSDLQSELAKNAELSAELNTLKELHSGQAQSESAAAQEIAELKANIKQLTEALSKEQTERANFEQANEEGNAELSDVRKALAKLQKSFETSQQEALELSAALTEAKNQPAPAAEQVVKEVIKEVVKEVTVKDTTAEEFLACMSPRACYLDMTGKVLCATGSFWEEVGATPLQGEGQAFSQWLTDSDAKVLATWFKKKNEPICQVTAVDGITWQACAVTDKDGKWIGASIEEVIVAPTPVAAASPIISFAPLPPSHMRTLSRELADEFSNLLTGVLGHASLAAAELDGNTSREISEIEKSAREAAHLVRKLSALGGQGRHMHECDLSPILQQFVKKLPNGFFGERPQIVLCDEGCRVNAEANSLRIVLEAISAHARDHLATNGHVCYTLSYTETQAFVSLSYDGTANFPSGWNDGQPPAVGQAGWDLIFAREVLRGMGGELEFSEDSGQAMLLLTFPMVKLVEA